MLADDLIELHRAPREVQPFTERYPDLTVDAAYDAARKLDAHRLAQGWRRVGRKVGFTNRTLWARYGVYEPMWGAVYVRTLVRAENDGAGVDLDGLVQPRIEPEICFGLGSAPRSARIEDLLAAIDWIAHSIEIVQCHHPAWKVRIADCAADNGLHGRLVVGTPRALAEFPGLAESLPRAEVELLRGETSVERGVGANVLGSPLLSLGHLVELLGRQPNAPPLAAGEIVTTGVLTDAHPVARGETWRTHFTGLALHGLTVTFA